MAESTYTTVKTVNRRGQTAELLFPNNESGQGLVETLKRRARREVLDEVKVGSSSRKGPEYPADVDPDRRRGRPVAGATEASAVVETDGNPTGDEGEKAERKGRKGGS